MSGLWEFSVGYLGRISADYWWDMSGLLVKRIAKLLISYRLESMLIPRYDIQETTKQLN